MTDGALLADNISALSNYTSEIEVLHATLRRLIIDELREQQRCGSEYREAGRPVSGSRSDASQWICTDVAWSLPLCSRRRRKDQPEMYLGFQISLVGDATAWSSPAEPMLHVFFWDVPVDFESYWVAYPRDDDSTVGASKALIQWESSGPGWQGRQWTFGVKLLSLRSSAELQERVVRPAFQLVNGVSDLEALPLDFAGLVRHDG